MKMSAGWSSLVNEVDRSLMKAKGRVVLRLKGSMNVFQQRVKSIYSPNRSRTDRHRRDIRQIAFSNANNVTADGLRILMPSDIVFISVYLVGIEFSSEDQRGLTNIRDSPVTVHPGSA
jgi:hypothetical protein